MRNILRQPDVIAQTFREVAASATTGLMVEQTGRLEELRTRRKMSENAIRSLLTLEGKSGPFIQLELGRLNGELNTLNAAITAIENATPHSPAANIELADVSSALQRLDPIWEVLIPDEQRRVLELLIEKIIVGKNQIKVQFRVDGIESLVNELSPLGTTKPARKSKRAKQK